jgi:hypothetical protein
VAGRHVGIDGFLEMKAQLVIELPLHLASMEQRPEPEPESLLQELASLL